MIRQDLWLHQAYVIHICMCGHNDKKNFLTYLLTLCLCLLGTTVGGACYYGAVMGVDVKINVFSLFIVFILLVMS